MMGNELRRDVLSRGLSSNGVVWIDEFRVRGAVQENQVCQTQMWLEGSKEKSGGDLCISSRLIDAHSITARLQQYMLLMIHI